MRLLKFTGCQKFILALALMGSASLLIFSCSGDSGKALGPSQTRPESFRFFDMGVNSVFDAQLREQLENRLDSDAIEYHSPLNLAFSYEGFLQDHFPTLHDLNRKLNPKSGARVEHSTIKLMYRHARRKQLPFEYVNLYFSNYSGRPLMFEIKTTQEGGYLLDTLKQQYGQPQAHDWPAYGAKSLYWEKNEDILLVWVTTNIYGNAEYQILIYYVGNLEDLLKIEKEEALEREKQRQEAARKAF